LSNNLFDYDPKLPFIEQASDWIADMFYEKLPEAGFEIRDEQIFMAFQLERAYAEKTAILAEAGVGTGKTLAYLLYAICYARYVRKPAVIACADESLIEQLVKPEGDIAKLARHLQVEIDARLGKSPDQYICLNKLDDAISGLEDAELYEDIRLSLPSFVHKPDTMQSFAPYGDRKAYSHLTDEEWERIGWDVFQDCLVCSRRHRCGQTLSRDYYRKSADVIICSHDFYMEHIWTSEARKREGQLPLLPEHSSVVFDEGHLLETAAQQALTYKLNHSYFERIALRLLEGEIRESLAHAIEDAIAASEELFEHLFENSRLGAGSARRHIQWSGNVLRSIARFTDTIHSIEEELVFEGGLFTLNEYGLKIVEEHLEMIGTALSLFKQEDKPITWLAEDKAGISLVIMPKWVKQVLKERLFSRKLPIVFSSATLSAGGSFQYIIDSLGLEKPLSFSVQSPYDYTNNMKVKAPAAGIMLDDEEKTELIMSRLHAAEGGSLILFPSMEELERFKQRLQENNRLMRHRFLFEGSGEISYLINQFQSDERSVLCAVTLWEGLDIPGSSLSQVIMWELPFPPSDPVFDSRRSDSVNPFNEVDMPYMLLRLRQGLGRLIRSGEDRGEVVIFGGKLNDAPVREQVSAVLPDGVVMEDLA